jgi:hypothetical protein
MGTGAREREIKVGLERVSVRKQGQMEHVSAREKSQIGARERERVRSELGAHERESEVRLECVSERVESDWNA